MRRHLVTLAAIGVLIAAVPAVVLLLGYSGTAATLAAILTAALGWVPALIAWEQIAPAPRIEGQTMPERPIDAGVLQGICRTLGYDPARVQRITLFPDRVVVDLVTRTGHGLVSRTEIRKVDE